MVKDVKTSRSASLGLQARQTQRPVMTPQLQQAIRLLRFDSQELSDYLALAVQSNPILEYGDDSSLGSSDSVSSDSVSSDSGSLDSDDSFSIGLGVGEGYGFEGYGSGSVRGDVWGGSDYDIFANVSDKPSLRDHIERQIDLEFTLFSDRLIAYRLLDLLDSSGWLSSEWSGLGLALGVSHDAVLGILLRLQGFDPVGIFARDLRECLILQLRDKGELSSSMMSLLDNLDYVGRYDDVSLCRLTGLEFCELADMLKLVRSLDPKPGSDFTIIESPSVVADLFLHQGGVGDWVIDLNPHTYPMICINKAYISASPFKKLTRAESHYISEQYGSAKWLLKSLRQRGETILKVGREIVKQQRAFFEYGVSHLRPLTLSDIAVATDLHESTISRTINGKYIGCQRGTFELKYFFTVALSSCHGGSVISAEAARWRIRSMIDAETPKKILSDSCIADSLVSEGIDIARRTVAKYRESMGIASSIHRRRMKNSSLMHV